MVWYFYHYIFVITLLAYDTN